MKTVQCLSIRQPYASLIMDTFKKYETRSWSAPYRGIIAIHAAKTWSAGEQRDLRTLLADYPYLTKFYLDPLPLGAIVGLCRLTKIYRVEDCREYFTPLERRVGNYQDGRFAWELEVVEKFKTPIPMVGQLGLFSIRMDEKGIVA